MSTVDELGIAHAGSAEATVAAFNRRAPRIAQADVFRAADELLVQGDRPTIDRVRMRLGRGSPNTINDHLDVWWAKLGARLRDLPGQEFPHLPERIAQTLQQLWREALDGARTALHETLAQREAGLAERGEALQRREHALIEREQTASTRAAALEEGLSLAREQLTAANQRAAALEARLRAGDAEAARLHQQLERWQTTATEAHAKTETMIAAHTAERAELQERAAAAERHWLLELDRARHSVREGAKQHEQQRKEWQRREATLQGEREALRGQVATLRADAQTARAVREQLEQRLRETSAAETASTRPIKPRIATPRARRGKRHSTSVKRPAK